MPDRRPCYGDLFVRVGSLERRAAPAIPGAEADETLLLPAVDEVDAADAKIGSFMSDLDAFRSTVEEYASDDMSLEDAVFLDGAGVATANRPRDVDLAEYARLLAFAAEVLRDAEYIAEDARKLQAALLRAYREYVIEAKSHA